MYLFCWSKDILNYISQHLGFYQENLKISERIQTMHYVFSIFLILLKYAQEFGERKLKWNASFNVFVSLLCRVFGLVQTSRKTWIQSLSIIL